MSHNMDSLCLCYVCLKYITQLQETQGFCVAEFATLSDERISRSKIFPLWIKEPGGRKFLGFCKISMCFTEIHVNRF